MSEVADPEKKYVLVAVKNCGLRAGDFMTMTRGDSNLTLTGTIISGNWDRNTMPRTYNVTLTVGYAAGNKGMKVIAVVLDEEQPFFMWMTVIIGYVILITGVVYL